MFGEFSMSMEAVAVVSAVFLMCVIPLGSIAGNRIRLMRHHHHMLAGSVIALRSEVHRLEERVRQLEALARKPSEPTGG